VLEPLHRSPRQTHDTVIRKAKPLRKSIPSCLCIVTLTENVWGCFTEANTEAAYTVTRPVFLSHIVGREDLVVQHQPGKRPALRFSSRTPDCCSRKIGEGAQELALIGRGYREYFPSDRPTKSNQSMSTLRVFIWLSNTFNYYTNA
jgi:hypothetical protein